ncbi:hypothetical protein D0V76_10315 [Salmonella enterica]|uniref:Uncharacterized protein n=2 Tax=Salmonella enterica TaxID=28901 RepID=A0A602Z709_SALET|nr:hypothetical protein [Salmonella enterica subsp. enterica serovar Pensacola]EBI6375076.1 hypothetical protein [Salmonella enterica]EBI6679768.1 hypothetical protein [Salmonella enterica]EBJ3196114.1 hypothetical protein [Salmonella enterica]EBJ5130545.1 hypothetical protein [Salmonella enterica]
MVVEFIRLLMCMTKMLFYILCTNASVESLMILEKFDNDHDILDDKHGKFKVYKNLVELPSTAIRDATVIGEIDNPSSGYVDAGQAVKYNIRADGEQLLEIGEHRLTVRLLVYTD